MVSSARHLLSRFLDFPNAVQAPTEIRAVQLHKLVTARDGYRVAQRKRCDPSTDPRCGSGRSSDNQTYSTPVARLLKVRLPVNLASITAEPPHPAKCHETSCPGRYFHVSGTRKSIHRIPWTPKGPNDHVGPRNSEISHQPCTKGGPTRPHSILMKYPPTASGNDIKSLVQHQVSVAV